MDSRKADVMGSNVLKCKKYDISISTLEKSSLDRTAVRWARGGWKN